MLHLFQVFIYQPFLNLLVFIYWLLDLIPGTVADMGIAVVIFTVIIRILMLPLSLRAIRGEKERRQIAEEIHRVEEQYKHDPIRSRDEVKKTFRTNRSVVISELLSLFIQVMISLMLWRIFGQGLPGADLHLIYPWMPEVDFPFNLMFLGRYDLSHPDWHLNLVQSILIFILETLSLYVTPFPVTRGEVVRLQLIMPVISFVIFSQLPAGKKLFVITTLSFSIMLTLGRAIVKKAYEIQDRLHKQDNASKEEKVVVDVK